MITILFRANVWIKYVIVVDPDIDVFDEPEVLWAVATRSRVTGDYLSFTEQPSSDMDPTTNHGPPERGGLDATIPIEGGYSERVGLPREVLEHINLSDYGL